MSTRAGFAEADITPPLGTRKIGWLKDIVGDTVLDPLFAKVAIFESGPEKIGFIALDTLSIRWTQVNDIRQRIAAKYGFPAVNILVAATHNHCGPAVANCGEVRRDDAYVERMVNTVVMMFGQALDARLEAEVGFGRCAEFNVAYNRRVVMRDGTARTHARFDDPNALHMEGPVDPELAVLAARNKQGQLLGVVVNFACHPTSHGDTTAFTAGWPGVLAKALKSRGCPVTIFLNGASGNISTHDPRSAAPRPTMEQTGLALADGVSRVLPTIRFRSELTLAARSQTVALPYRTVTDAETQGTVRGAQRAVDPKIYERTMPAVVERIRTRGSQPAEVQALFLDECAFVGIPAECFVQHGLRIKEESHPKHALVVNCANGMVGYLPHRDAFLRGGYETTFGGHSRMAPEAGDIVANCAIRLIRSQP